MEPSRRSGSSEDANAVYLTIDSSVFVAALRRNEPSHAACLGLLGQLADGRHVAIEPLTVVVEIGAAIRRRTNSESLARRIVTDLRTFRSLEFI